MIKRVLSAIVLLSIIIPLIYVGGKYFTLAACLIAMLAYKELLALKYNKNKIPVLIQIFGFVLTALFVISNSMYSYEFGLNYRTIIISILAFMLPLLFYKKENYNSKDAFYLIGISIFIGICFNGFILVRTFNLYKFIYLLIIPILTDTFAMIFGLIMGKHKLCPSISPKKSWEGSIGGSIIATIMAVLYYKYFIGSFTITIIMITLLLSVIGQLGDLVFSRIKRDNEVKDYSNLIPGHGGILDRLDSIIFVILCYIIIHSLI